MPGVLTGHVGLNVTDLGRSTSFYTAALGLEVLEESPDPERRYSFLGSDGELLLTLWEQSTGESSTTMPGLHHLAFQVPDLTALRERETALRDIGATLVYDGIIRGDETSETAKVFFTDPDGIRLEIYAATGGADAPAPTGAAPACGFF